MKNRLLNAIYSLLPFLLFFFAARLTHAQSILLTHNPSIKYEMLTDSQQRNFTFLGLENKESKFVEFAPKAIEDSNGLVKVALGYAYLDAIVFKMKYIDYKTFEDFSWTGVYFDTANQLFARLFVVVQGNKIYGNISTHKGDYYIRDIGGGLAVFSFDDNSAPATPTPVYLKLLPNPVEHQFAVDFFVPGQEHIRISLIDATGRELKLLYSGPGGSRHLTFDRDFAAGNYTLLLQGKHTRLSQKLVAR